MPPARVRPRSRSVGGRAGAGSPVHVAALVAALVAAMVAALGLGLAAQPALADAPPKRIISGWLPYWVTSPGKPQGVAAATANADLLTDVSPFWFSATKRAGGGVQVGFNSSFGSATANAAWATAQLKASGLPVLPSIADGSGKGAMAAALADPQKRAQHVADIVALVTANGYDGIDLDYEVFAFTDGNASWAATQPNWTQFVTDLAAALHAQGKQLSVTIPPPCGQNSACGPQTGYWVYNIASIGQVVDRLRIMTYDYHVSTPGPIAPIGWVRANAQYAASVMPAGKVWLGVPTYGRTWTLKDASGKYQLSGTCPTSGSTAYTSLTSPSSVAGSDIAGVLAAVGITPDRITFDAASQESTVSYPKSVTWTDGAGAQQTCTATRVMWFGSPQAVTVRTGLVGELGLGGAAFWTIGGEDPGQWAALRGYAVSLNPAPSTVTATGVPVATYGTAVAVTATVTTPAGPLAGTPATLRFRAQGAKDWTDVQTVATNPDGTVAFQVTPTATGDWLVFVPGATGRSEGASAPFTTQVLAMVVATPKVAVVAKGGVLKVRVVAQPASAGQPVVLQVKQPDGTWANVKKGRGKANAQGVVKLVAVAPSAKGTYTMRAIALQRGPILTGASAEFSLRVK